MSALSASYRGAGSLGSRAGRSRRNVRSRIDGQKCRLAIIRMHAEYRVSADHGGPFDMEMHQVRYFLAVCETLNFTRASENCNVSQPALTRAVHKLEEELGGLLLRRENNLTHLTDLGRLVRPHLEQLMAQAEAAKSA